MLTLAWMIGAGLLGPLVTAISKNAIPVAMGELVAGVVLGQSGFKLVPLHNQSVQLISAIGFALLMMSVGSHINLPKLFNREFLPKLARNILATLLAATLLSLLVAKLLNFHHLALLILLASASSAAIILPAIAIPKSIGPELKLLIAQVSITDFLALLILPLALASGDGSKRAIGSLLIAAIAALLYIFLRWLDQRGWHQRVAMTSKSEHLGVELRFSMLVLLLLAGVAVKFSVSPMVAGFAIGLVLGAVGLPRRLGKQIFAVSEGFFTPIFFVTLGATLDVRAALSQPRLLELALAIFLTNLIAHLVVHRRGKLIWLTLIAVAQLGVPVAAVTMAFSIGTLSAGEGAAIMLAALLSVLVAIISAAKYRSAISPREKS